MTSTFCRHLLFILLGLLLLALHACTGRRQEPNFTIGFSQCAVGPWRDNMLAEMKRELSIYPNVTLLFEQAEGSTAKQITQTKALIRKNIDLLIISPNEAGPLTPVVEEAFKKGIPVIVIDRKIAAPIYTAYVGGDNYEVGKMAGEYAAHLLKGGGRVMEITVLPGSSPAAERHQGFTDALKAFPRMTLVQQVNGELLKDKTNRQLAALFNPAPEADLIFAQNDFLAVRIADFYKGLGRRPPHIIGVDGLPQEGMQLVADKTITATMLYPTGGEDAIRTAMDILTKRDFVRENKIGTTVIDSTNVRYMRIQAEKMMSQQKAIERQQSMMDNLKAIYNNQQTFVYVLALSLILSVVLGGLALYSLRENRKINRKLLEQNEEILAQKEQLELMSAKAQEANEAKVSFFTNISHEFRTPLTLILGPLEDLLASPKLQQGTHQSLQLIQKNVYRLLRLVNQLMDFRKIEANKMKVQAAEHDLVSFLAEMVQPYKSIAAKRSIDLRLITNERQLLAWFDANMLDKVLFNLLSNAFKFTGDGGWIHLSLHKKEDGSAAVIKIEDNGVGMSQEALAHSFEVFYQGEHENYKGSGLGLALSKQLIELHQGTIGIASEKEKGTAFTIVLPLGSGHLQDSISETGRAQPIFEQEKIYTSDLQLTPAGTEEATVTTAQEQSLLVVEDNSDLRQFIMQKFRGRFEVLEAADSQSALQVAFDRIPDLIICDVVIPGNDGMAITQLLKNDIRTAHIPIILLTAKSSSEQQVTGMKTGADAYITKPFDAAFLQETVNSLLANRAKLREHFTGELASGIKTQTVGKLDRKFINEFSAIVATNLGNDAFTVEDLCKEMAVSRVQLNRKLKALLNTNASDYILNARLQKAKYLLQHEDLTIAEIAYQVGFASPAYFSTVFKSKFGTTPKAFKDR